MKYPHPDEFAGVSMDAGRFFILFNHRTGRGTARKRVLLRAEDVEALRHVLDAFELLNGQEREAAS